MEAKDLIERYTHEVGRNLPRAQRADVQAELTSLLTDMLEERAAAAGRPADEALAVDVLRAFGEPGVVARRYGPQHQYLIGPAYFPAFNLTLRIVLAVLGALFTLAIGFKLSGADNPLAELGSTLVRLAPDYLGYVLANTGLIAIIFAIVERVNAGREPDSADWNPRSLPAVEDPNRLDRSDAIATLVFTGALLVLFNFAPNWIDYLVVHDGEWGSWTVLSPDFFVHLPWLNVSWLWDLGLNLAVLRRGRWEPLTRWAEFAGSVFGVVVVYRMITGGELASVVILTVLIKGALAIALVVGTVEACVQLYRLIAAARARRELAFKPNGASEAR